MRTLKNTFYVSIDTAEDEFVKREDGSNTGLIWLEGSSFSKYQFRNQKATIAVVPEHYDLTTETAYGKLPLMNVELKVGDTVYVNHFTADKDFEEIVDGKPLYRILYSQIFILERDGALIPLHTYNLVEPIPQDEMQISESGIIVSLNVKYVTEKDANGKDYQKTVNERFIRGRGIIRAVGKLSQDVLGIKEGDTAILLPSCEYEMVIDNKMYWRVPMEFIVAVNNE